MSAAEQDPDDELVLARTLIELVASISDALGADTVSVAILDHDRALFQMSAHAGVRSNAYGTLAIAPGEGLGGLVAEKAHTVALADYLTSTEITDLYRPAVSAEGLRGMACVPLRGPGGTSLLLYAGNRSVDSLDDRTVGRLEGLALGVQQAVQRTRSAAVVPLPPESRGARYVPDAIAQLLACIASTAEERGPEAIERIAGLAQAGCRLIDPHVPIETAEDADALTPRERLVLTLVGEGLSTRRIAHALGNTDSTVKWHVRRAMGKLGAESRWQAVVVARELGLI